VYFICTYVLYSYTFHVHLHMYLLLALARSLAHSRALFLSISLWFFPFFLSPSTTPRSFVTRYTRVEVYYIHLHRYITYTYISILHTLTWVYYTYISILLFFSPSHHSPDHLWHSIHWQKYVTYTYISILHHALIQVCWCFSLPHTTAQIICDKAYTCVSILHKQH